MGILRSDRITGLGGANAITGSTYFVAGSGTSHGQYLRVEDLDGDFKFGTSDFTIEFWMNTPTVDTSDIGAESSFATMLDHGYGFSENASGAWWVLHHKDATLIWGFNGSNQLTSSSFIKVNTWHHIAVVRTGGNTKIYADGTQVGTVSDSQNYTDALARPLDIGAQTYQTTYRNYEGFISNLRIINGTALYTSAFTPPTTRLTKTSDTVLLTCNSTSDILHEETGKIISPNRNTVSSSYATARRDTPNTPVGFSTTTDVGSQYGTTFDGFTVFATSTYMVPPGGNTRERNRGRGFFMVGYANPNQVDDIDYLNIQSFGNTISFGNLTTGKYSMGAGASSTRGIFCGGYQGGASPDTDINAIEFITIASEGNATDFGDRTVVGRSIAAASSSTRCVMASGLTGAGIQNTIDLVEFATAANAIDFGDLLAATNDMCNACNSPTRGIFSGGNTPSSPNKQNVMQFVTMASTGDATDYGDLTEAGRSSYGGTASSNTRGLILIATGDHSNVINFTTIATTGNAANFGDLFTGRYGTGSCSDSTRAVFLAGRTPSYINTMDTVTIATTGNAIDFGDVSGASGGSAFGAAGSDSHGGLS